MAKLFKFEVVTPMRKFFVGDVASIVFETENGQMGVMADHIPMLVANKDCTLKIVGEKETKFAFITEGFIEITGKKVTAIVDDAEWCDEIDTQKDLDSIRRAEEELNDAKNDLGMKAELQASIRRSNARIKSAGVINRN